MASFEIKADNSQEVLRQLKINMEKALEECGLVAEGYAKVKLTEQLSKTPPEYSTTTGVLKNSISHRVVTENGELVCYVGAGTHNPPYSIYVEMGTGQYYNGGRKTPWKYKDSKGNWHLTNGVRPRPFIRPAVSDHVTQYRQIVERNLKG